MNQLIPKYRHHLPLLGAFLMLTSLTAAPAGAAQCQVNCLSIFSHTLINRGAYLHDTVTLVDETGAGGGARGSVVHARWNKPDGSVLDQYALVGTRLRAEFKLYGATEPGTYSLSVLDATKPDYTFSPKNKALLTRRISVAGSSNLAPVAIANADATSGSVPLDVLFESRGSFDPDGVIVSYAWAFGDGAVSTDVMPAHRYHSAGNFMAALTVTDEHGATGTSALPILVVDGNQGCNSDCVAVDRMSMRYQKKNHTLSALVWLMDETGARVRDAVVHAVWIDPNGSAVEQAIDIGTRARAVFKLPAAAAGIYQLNIVEVIKPGYAFDSENSNLLNGLIEIAP